ncbi:MAG: hypothetical protein EOO05_21570, partial [Chitinophagaceae bacterium]
MNRTYKSLTICGALLAATGFKSEAANASVTHVYGLSGLSNTVTLYDADTLKPFGKAAPSNGWFNYDLAFDNTGRLFGTGHLNGGDALLEYDPATGAVINSAAITGDISTMAARNGILYSLTGLSNTVVMYDADTLKPIGRPALSNVWGHYDLTFDNAGRLFGAGYLNGRDALLEYDPATGAVINSSTITGNIITVAARDGILYSLTGLSNTVVMYDADTLKPIGRPALSNVWGHYDLAFDNTGRLFGTGFLNGRDALLEFDPATGAVI